MTNSLPPWLDVGPKDYLNAIQAGTQTGLEVARMRAAQQEAVARRVAAQQEAQRQAWEFGENLRQQAALAQMQNERQTSYNEGMLDWHNQQLELNTRNALRQAEMDKETKRHNLVTEGISLAEAQNKVKNGGAEIVTHPEAPGYMFLRNPSGSEQVVIRPDKELSESDKMGYTFRAFNAMKPGATTDETSPMWQAQTNYAGNVLQKLGALPKPAAEPTLDLSSPLSEFNLGNIGGPPALSLEPLAIRPSLAPSSGTEQSPYPDGTILRKKDGSRWIVQDGVPVPYNQ